MQTIVTSQQINHFAQFGWIEFEKFFSEEECAALHSAILGAVAQRLGTDVKKLSRCSDQQLYLNARDCWRNAPLLKQFFCNKRCTFIAGSLTNKQAMLLACDQWIPPKTSLEPLRLNAHMSCQNIACGCLLSLDGAQAGNARFFHPDRLPLFRLRDIETESQIAVVYANLNSVYIHNPMDPCNSDLKRYGYSFNDRLKSEYHPFCKGF
jgi:hypothetical protein